jgi:hypothetical protein
MHPPARAFTEDTPDMTGNGSNAEYSLTPEELDLLVRFFRRAMRLYEIGVVSPEAVLEYLKLVTDAMDPQQPGSVAALRSALEDAWREADG